MKIKAQYIQNGQLIKELFLTRSEANKLCRATGTLLTKANIETNPLKITWGSQIKLFVIKDRRSI